REGSPSFRGDTGPGVASGSPAPVPSPPPTAPVPPPPATPPPETWSLPGTPPPARIPARRPREHSGLGLATLGIAFVVVGVAAVLHNAGAVHLSLSQYAALALTLLAGGLLVGTWWGRARWLALPAAALVPLILVAS